MLNLVFLCTKLYLQYIFLIRLEAIERRSRRFLRVSYSARIEVERPHARSMDVTFVVSHC